MRKMRQISEIFHPQIFALRALRQQQHTRVLSSVSQASCDAANYTEGSGMAIARATL
jgi:hypothetical protein